MRILLDELGSLAARTLVVVFLAGFDVSRERHRFRVY